MSVARSHMWDLICAALSLNTLDVALVSDSLVGGSTRKELLELHPGFLLV